MRMEVSFIRFPPLVVRFVCRLRACAGESWSSLAQCTGARARSFKIGRLDASCLIQGNAERVERCGWFGLSKYRRSFVNRSNGRVLLHGDCERLSNADSPVHTIVGPHGDVSFPNEYTRTKRLGQIAPSVPRRWLRRAAAHGLPADRCAGYLHAHSQPRASVGCVGRGPTGSSRCWGAGSRGSV